MPVNSVENSYRQICTQIEDAARAAARLPASVKLVVVTKGHPAQSIRKVVAAGARCLGENYLEEARDKIQALADFDLEWRMIGHVQSRKAAGVVELFSAVDSIDSLKLARRLDRFTSQAGRLLPVLLECNLSGEQSKSGLPAWNEARWAELLGEIGEMLSLPNLQVRGLMCMPPYFDEPELARPYFQKLRRLQAYLRQQFPAGNWDELSMGMSGDFVVAIQEGATQVRIGTAIMGERHE